MGLFSRFHNFFPAAVAQGTVGNVGGDGIVEQHHVLVHQSNLGAQGLKRKLLQFMVINADSSPGVLVETG